MPPLVEVFPSWSFRCLACGATNVLPCVRPKLTEEERQAAEEALGIEPWEEGQLLTYPTQVRCELCSAEFRTIDDEDDDDG